MPRTKMKNTLLDSIDSWLVLGIATSAIEGVDNDDDAGTNDLLLRAFGLGFVAFRKEG